MKWNQCQIHCKYTWICFNTSIYILLIPSYCTEEHKNRVKSVKYNKFWYNPRPKISLPPPPLPPFPAPLPPSPALFIPVPHPLYPRPTYPRPPVHPLSNGNNDFRYFWPTSHPDTFYQVSSQLAFLFRRKQVKKDFQYGGHCWYLGFPILTMLTIFDQQISQILPTKFWVNWSFSSGEEVQNRFSRWQPSWICNQNDFS